MSETTDHSEILQAMDGAIDPVKVPLLYRLGLVLVAIAMVLLPLIYVAVIGLVVYGIKLHIEYGSVLLTGSGRGRLLLFLTPIVVGAVLVLFMVKPLFARKPKSARPLILDPAREDTLFAFVERICGIVGSPKPKEIRVDCMVNASAGFRRGFLSFFGEDLVLTIGLPLVAGLDLRQFAGVVAHEFGHFAQGTGMRLTYVIRAVNVWFARVVYERDAWDVALREWAGRIDFRVAGMLHLSRFFVWLTRRVLWALMMVGHGISCFMMRQMEFDADRYEARVSGSDTFESTARRLQYLNVAAQGAYGLLEQSWQEGRLAEDLPRLIDEHVGRIPAEIRTQIVDHIRQQKTSFFDTHPSDGDRIASARREQAVGIFRVECPATALFTDFDALAKDATKAHYAVLLEADPDDVVVVSNASLLAVQESLHRFFQMRLPVSRLVLLHVEDPDEEEHWEAAHDAVRQTRSAMGKACADAARAIKKCSQAARAASLATQAKALIEGGVNVDAGEFGLDRPSADAADAAISRANSEQQECAPAIEDYLAQGARRITSALRLLRDPQVVERIHDASELAETVGRMVETLTELNRAHPQYVRLREALIEQMALLSHLEGNETNSSLTGAIVYLSSELRKHLFELRELLSARFPFCRAGSALRLYEYVVPAEIVASEHAAEMAGQAQAVAQRYEEVYLRVLGRLTHAVERVEGAFGMRPLGG